MRGLWKKLSVQSPAEKPEGQALRCPLAPAAGHKGYGLAMAVEILSSFLSGGPASLNVLSWIRQKAEPIGAAFTVITIDIAASQDVAVFKRRMREWADRLISSPRRPGIDRIWYPGEREGETHERRSRDGIPLDGEAAAVFEDMADACAATVRSHASDRGEPE